MFGKQIYNIKNQKSNDMKGQESTGVESIFYKTSELKELLGVKDYQTVWKLLASMKVPVIKVGTRKYVKKCDMNKHLVSQSA